METCTYGLGADIWKPTTERWQGAEYRAYWYNSTPYLFSSSPTRRRRAGEEFFWGGYSITQGLHPVLCYVALSGLGCARLCRFLSYTKIQNFYHIEK